MLFKRIHFSQLINLKVQSNKFDKNSWIIWIRIFGFNFFIYSELNRLDSYSIYNASVYSVLVFVSCPKVLYHLEIDNIFRITLVVADWLAWNPYHRSSFFTVSDWIILKFKLIYRWNFMSASLGKRNGK